MGEKVTRDDLARRLKIEKRSLDNILSGFRGCRGIMGLISRATRRGVRIEEVLAWHEKWGRKKRPSPAVVGAEQAA